MYPFFLERVVLIKLINRNRWIYYGAGCIALLPCTIIFELFNVSLLNTMFYFTAFIWNFAIYTPGVRSKLRDSRRYRYSFLKTIVKLEQALRLKVKQNLKIRKYGVDALSRSLIPFLFFLTLFLLLGVGNILFSILGLLTFEIFLLLFSNKDSLRVFKKLRLILRKRRRS